MNAARIIRGTRVQEISPKHYLDGERSMAKEAVDLLAEAKRALEGGKKDEADRLYSDALHKWDAVLLAKMLWRHAASALKQIESAEAKLKRAAKTPWAQKLGKADIVYADANDAILGAVGFKEDVKPDSSVIDRALAALKRDGATDIVEGEDGRLNSSLWDSQHIRDIAGNPVAWEVSTFEEAMNVADAVDNIRRVAGNRNKVQIGERKMERDELIAATDESSAKLGPTNEPANKDALGVVKKALHAGKTLFSHIDANLSEVRQSIERLTGGDRKHPLYTLFVDEREKARDLEQRLSEQFGERITKLWNDLPKEMRKAVNEVIAGARDALPLPDTGGILNPKSPMTRSELWMVALNLGNAGNKQRLLDGFGWSEGQVRAVLEAHLSKEEWQWVQGVWDSLGELYPHIERVHIEDTGLRPDKIEALPFKIKTADGEVEMRGGYFPARYDPRVPSKQHIGEKQEAASVEALMTPFYRTAKVATGHAQQRAEENADLLNLNFNIIPAHVQQVIHDVSHRLWVKQAGGVVLDPRFQQLVAGRLGLAYEKQFPSWVKSVASQFTTSAGDTLAPLNGLLSWAKSRTTLAAVGFNIAVPLQDLTNPLLPVLGGDLSPVALAQVTRRLATDWSSFRAFALENSIELRARAKHGNSLGIDIPGLVKRKGTLGEVEKAAYWMMETSDRATSTPVWLAKYYEGLKAGAEHEDAVRDAEALVQKYFPASDMASRAAILRDRGLLGSLTFLYGFGSKVYNINRATVMNAYDTFREPGSTAGDKAKAIGTAMFVMTAQAAAMATSETSSLATGRRGRTTRRTGWPSARCRSPRTRSPSFSSPSAGALRFRRRVFTRS
jgi:hypothetical protein